MHVLGALAAYKKAFRGLVVYEVALIMLFFAVIILSVEDVNKARPNLAGCCKMEVGSFDIYYIETIIYSTVAIVLLALALRLMYVIRKIKKAENLYEEYLLKAENQMGNYT